MRTFTKLWGLTLILGTTWTARADDAATLKNSLQAVNKAMNAVRKDSDACKKAALADLKNARDMLEASRGKANVDIFARAKRHTEDALDGSSSSCNTASKNAIQEAFDILSGNFDTQNEIASQPSPGEKKLQEKRNCWNYKNDWTDVDQACHIQVKGQFIINKADFQKILGKIQNSDDRFAKSKVLEDEFGYGGKKKLVSCMQVAAFLQRLTMDTDRLEAFKLISPKLVDSHNLGLVARTISDATIRGEIMDTQSETDTYHAND